MLGLESIGNLVATAIDKAWPDANIEAQAKADELKNKLTLELQAVLGQLDINKAEAAHASVFVSGWRPAVGWVCASGFGYEFLLRPLVNGVAISLGMPPVFPGIEVDALSSLLTGLLGLGGLRTIEKIKGVARR
ncbi:MAG: hypothetical protein CTY18_06045 [Methylomonas sp.]|nr:MAG: hypothetical protein CTY24_11805 [Methylobacter sp.]PPD36035.1 MAG: hypothetical protein CTY18_06045 [Methylomonas sp.]